VGVVQRPPAQVFARKMTFRDIAVEANACPGCGRHRKRTNRGEWICSVCRAEARRLRRGGETPVRSLVCEHCSAEFEQSGPGPSRRFCESCLSVSARIGRACVTCGEPLDPVLSSHQNQCHACKRETRQLKRLARRRA
jgi:hypothetical protein